MPYQPRLWVYSPLSKDGGSLSGTAAFQDKYDIRALPVQS